jgi:hypothetical protein
MIRTELKEQTSAFLFRFHRVRSPSAGKRCAGKSTDQQSFFAGLAVSYKKVPGRK